MVLLATVIPALMALAAALVFLLWRRRQRVAASDAFLGKLADSTSIEFVYHVCAFLPAIGILTALLPNMEPARRRA